jgi:hypothetical protein
MHLAKDFGKSARMKKINAPTLDDNFLDWLKTTNGDQRIHHLMEWWEGWYEIFDENLFRQEGQLNTRKSQSTF